MLTVKDIAGVSELEIKKMRVGDRLALQNQLIKDNEHNAVILVDAVVQSHQTVIEGVCFIETLKNEIGHMTQAMYDMRNQLQAMLS
jgi:hypothetical protein